MEALHPNDGLYGEIYNLESEYELAEHGAGDLQEVERRIKEWLAQFDGAYDSLLSRAV